MSDSVKLVVSKVWSETIKGTEWVYIKGRNTADDSGFQTRTFAEYKGNATKTAEALYGCKNGDYVELGMKKNGKYLNLDTVTKLDEEAPENTKPQESKGKSSGGSGSGYSGGGGGSNKMSKAEWAAKDAKKEASIARSVALKEAVNVALAQQVFDTDEIIDISVAFEGYLLKGRRTVGDEPATENVPTNTGSDDTPPDHGDDDIPF